MGVEGLGCREILSLGNQPDPREDGHRRKLCGHFHSDPICWATLGPVQQVAKVVSKAWDPARGIRQLLTGSQYSEQVDECLHHRCWEPADNGRH